MGNEAKCAVKFGKRKAEGKALLETSELVFRGTEDGFRLKIAFSDIKSARAVDGELRLQTADGLAVFELGAAEKWCEKILHPKTRVEKLGIKPDASVSLVGDFDEEFWRELRGVTNNIHDGKIDASSESIFVSADSAKDLAGIGKVAKAMRGATALWVVYPKGKKEITENEVLAAGRKAGLKDVKVAGFSETHGSEICDSGFGPLGAL
jgi:hypothetical protein